MFMDAEDEERRNVPKLRDLVRRQRPDSDSECPDVAFEYDDTDSHLNEISEWYSYSEEPEYQLNKKAFDELLEEYGVSGSWPQLPEQTRRSIVFRFMDQVDVSQRLQRQTGSRAILYIAQGNWGECLSEEEQQHWERQNVFLLYDCGVFNTFVELLNMEVDNSSAANSALRKPAVSLADSTDLRVILSVLYSMCEVMRCSQDSDTDEMKRQREEFKIEISQPMKGNELLAVLLFSMVTKFCSGTTPHFPMKKVLLLLWKTILVSLGGTQEFRKLKMEYREEADLPVETEDTIEVTRNMRASSPPASAADLIEAQQQKRANRPFRRGLTKQSSLDEPIGFTDLDDERTDEELRDIVENNIIEENCDFPQPPSPRPSTPCLNKGLPWVPKVRLKDIENFLDHIRVKFVGYNLEGDCSSLEGLPLPIHEGVRVLKQHIYVSLGEIQIKQEEDILKNLLSKPEEIPSHRPTEILYQAMLPSLPQYMIALLKILLAAAPTSKTKSDSVNIMADVLPEEMPMTVFQSMKLGIDVNRHKEIIVKAVSGILLLLLKHLKINHIYQFEFVSQHMVFANCIPLVLKFFNQNIVSYIQSKSSVAIMDFPSCVIGDQPEITKDTLCSYQQIGVNNAFCWRNMYSCINLLRILNKLTKWKHSRIMMLVVFKSAPILKRTLKIKHAMMQLYVLKLLKLQTKYLGRQWRKSNMKTMSAIYQKVRHRLNDDWAYGNDMDARPWDFQAEECTLRTCVDRFNNRRYSTAPVDPELEPVDNCILSVLGQRIDLTEEFKQHYELWLHQEVFQANIDWGQLVCKHML